MEQTSRQGIAQPGADRERAFGDQDLIALARGMTIVAARVLRVPEDVEEAVQETLARAIRARRSGRLKEGDSPAPFVYGILKHVLADVVRERYRRRGVALPVEGLPNPAPNVLELLVRAEERERAKRALLELSADERHLLDLCYRRGERVVDIAARLGVPPARLRKRKSRALRRLRALLARDAPAARHEPTSDPR